MFLGSPLCLTHKTIFLGLPERGALGMGPHVGFELLLEGLELRCLVVIGGFELLDGFNQVGIGIPQKHRRVVGRGNLAPSVSADVRSPLSEIERS